MVHIIPLFYLLYIPRDPAAVGAVVQHFLIGAESELDAKAFVEDEFADLVAEHRFDRVIQLPGMTDTGLDQVHMRLAPVE